MAAAWAEPAPPKDAELVELDCWPRASEEAEGPPKPGVPDGIAGFPPKAGAVPPAAPAPPKETVFEPKPKVDGVEGG